MFIINYVFIIQFSIIFCLLLAAISSAQSSLEGKLTLLVIGVKLMLPNIWKQSRTGHRNRALCYISVFWEFSLNLHKRQLLRSAQAIQHTVPALKNLQAAEFIVGTFICLFAFGKLFYVTWNIYDTTITLCVCWNSHLCF